VIATRLQWSKEENRNESHPTVSRTRQAAGERVGEHTFRLMRDDRVRGFALRVLDSGTKVFLLMTRVKGKPRWISIGRLPEWSVVQARDHAEKLRSEIAHGGDPVSDKQREAEEPTFGALAERFYEHGKTQKQKSIRDHRETHHALLLCLAEPQGAGDHKKRHRETACAHRRRA
jgi:hypothetical protein